MFGAPSGTGQALQLLLPWLSTTMSWSSLTLTGLLYAPAAWTSRCGPESLTPQLTCERQDRLLPCTKGPCLHTPQNTSRLTDHTNPLKQCCAFLRRPPYPPHCLQQETLKELPPLLASGFWPHLKAVQEGRVVLVDGNAMFNRPGPRLVDCFEFLVGLLHNRHDVIPHDFPWRFLGEELADEVAAWLASHPGWKTRVQQGPKPREDGTAAVAVCCGPQGCTPVAAAPAAAATAASPAGDGC